MSTDGAGLQLAGDLRLHDADSALDDPGIEVLSLDIFDTLLWRIVPEPTDAFVLLGRRLLDTEMLNRRVDATAFAHMREAAERRQRQRAAAEGHTAEITLRSIWEAFPSWLLLGHEPKEYVDFEVEFERSILVPDLEVAGLARRAKMEPGRRLVLVSDTYFSESQLRRLLDRPELADLTIDRIFASSHHGVGKGSGLWKVVLEALGSAPDAILHVGDHDDADVRVPRALGIRVTHYPKVARMLGSILEREGILERPYQREKPTLSPVRGDCGLTAMRTKVLSTGRQPDKRTDNPYWAFGASVLGPVFTAFGEWVLRRAEDEGVVRVHCLMREGEFLTRLINGTALYTRSPVRAVPLWLSRQVCARAAIVDATSTELRKFLNRRVAPTVGRLCETLGVNIGEFPDLQLYGDSRVDAPEVGPFVLEYLVGNDQARGQIGAAAAVARKRLIDHVLSATGDAGTAVFVDLGWGGTIQERLNAALVASGVDLRTVGLYLLTNKDATDRAIDGVEMSGFLASFGSPEAVSKWVVRSPEVLEQLCMCDEGSLIDIASDGTTVHGPVTTPPAQSLQRTAVQMGILSFQDLWARYRPLLPEAAQNLDGDLVPQLRKMVSRFVMLPTPEEAAIFGSWIHDENFGSASAENMITEEIAPSLGYMTPRALLDLPMSAIYWPFGAAALHNPSLGLAAAAIVDGILPEEAFAAGDPVEVRFSLDAGAGFYSDGWHKIFPSPSGRYLLRRTMTADRVRAVAVDCGRRPGILRIDWLRMVFQPAAGEPVELHMVLPADIRRLLFRNCVVLGDNLLLGYRVGPQVSWRAHSDWAEQSYRVDLELAFGWLPCGPVRGAPPTNVESLLAAGRQVAGKAHNVWTTARRSGYGRLRAPR